MSNSNDTMKHYWFESIKEIEYYYIQYHAYKCRQQKGKEIIPRQC